MLRLIYLLYRLFQFVFRPITLGVRVMMVKDGQVLLIRHTYMDRGSWYLPGGGLRRGETVETAARREIREEAGAEAGAFSLVGIYSKFDDLKSDHNVVFLCNDFSLGGQPDSEIAELRFFPLDALPDTLCPGHRQRIEEYAAGKTSPAFGNW